MAKKDIKKANWSGRFNEPVTELVKRFTASIGFDQKDLKMLEKE
jgi:argininosuccinate lyase